MRSIVMLGVSVLVALALAGQAVAGTISISGDRDYNVYNVIVRDADLVEALVALFAANHGQRMLQLSDGVTGHVDKVQLSDVPFDVALQALLGDAYQFEVGSNKVSALYRITNPKVPAPVVAPLPAEPERVQLALPPMIPEDPRYSIRLHYIAYGTGSGYTAASVENRISRSDRTDRRSRGIRYSESTPYIINEEYFGPDGSIIRQPQVYYQTSGMNLNIGESMTTYPDWSATPYLNTDALDLDQYLDLGGDTGVGDGGG